MNKDAFLPDKNYAKKNLGNVCVIGLGKTGFSLAEYLERLIGTRVASLHIYAGDKTEYSMKMADKLLKKSIDVSFDDDKISKKYDLCIVSPGISPNDNLYKSAQENSVELIGEVEFAWRECDKNPRWVAITGTNGKTTTVSLISHIINKTRFNAVSVGNIGNVSIDEIYKDTKKSIYNKTNIYVAELSSYQLHTLKNFSSDVCSLLNITPDHISWHGSFENYKKDKYRVFNNTKYSVINEDDPLKNEYEKFIKKNNKLCKIAYYKSNEENICIYDKDGKLNTLVTTDKLQIKGKHNIENANVAACVCNLLGISKKDIINGLITFKALEHRIEPCGIIAGIKLFNDSKATNIDATLHAISAFNKYNAIFLLGGKDKNTNLDELVDKCCEHLKGVIVYGEAKDRFYQAFVDRKDKQSYDKFILKRVDNMKEAFKLSLELAFPGDSIVLSPACASFDEFRNFEERGDVFKNLVKACKY